MINKKVIYLLLLSTISLMGMSSLRRYFVSNLPQFRSYSSYVQPSTSSLVSTMKPYNYTQGWFNRSVTPAYSSQKRNFSFMPWAMLKTAKSTDYGDYVAKVAQQKRQSDLDAIERKGKETQVEVAKILGQKRIILNDRMRSELDHLIKRYSEAYITSDQETEVNSSFQELKSFLSNPEKYK